jgi:hypothetical protein
MELLIRRFELNDHDVALIFIKKNTLNIVVKRYGLMASPAKNTLAFC